MHCIHVLLWNITKVGNGMGFMIIYKRAKVQLEVVFIIAVEWERVIINMVSERTVIASHSEAI